MKKLLSIAVTALVLSGVSAMAEKPSYEVAGFTITPHQVGVLGTVLRAGDIHERAATPTLTVGGMPASPHQVTVMTPRPTVTEQQVASRRVAD